MWRWLLVGCWLSSLALAGCGSSPTEAAKQPAHGGDNSPPEAVVGRFLEAVRTGNDETAAGLLTSLARKKTTEMNLEVAPPGSDTAKFTVGEVEYIAKDTAHVGSQWTDVDESGQPRTDPIVWVLRRDAEGWRIAGMATKVFENEPPLLLNFEEPEDMMRKQQLVAQEMQRRAGERAATTGDVPANAKRTVPDDAATPMRR
jgi:hypothetical protein